MEVSELDRVTLNSLRTLPDGLAEIVALHLAAAARLLADDPELALAHTKAASRRAGRVAIVREAVGVAAYAAGDYGTALTELKAASRISGSSDYLPMIADCERGLGRPERALALASSPEASTLDRAGKVELLIVAAGARRDLGQPEAAVLTLQVPALKSRGQGEWLARLRYAYADALLEVGRVREAREWFVRAAEVDPESSTDAQERVGEIDGITFEELEELEELEESVACRRARPGHPRDPHRWHRTSGARPVGVVRARTSMGGEPGPGPQANASPVNASARGAAGGTSGFGSTEAALAAVHDVALLDLDGVVYVGAGAVAHAAESLDAALDVHGMRSAFVTNNAARTPATVAAHLVALGLRAAPEDVVTSAQAGARMLAERLPRGSHVLVIGGPGVGEALRERGLVAVDSVDDATVAVMQGYGPDVGWRSLAEGSIAIGRGLLWVATNLDRTIPSPRGRVLGNGSMVAALRHATGAEPLVAGKPEPPLMLESVQRSGAVRPIVVGDRLDTDIEGANRSGIPSLLVLTGVTDWQELVDAAPLQRPTYLGLDLRALLAPAPPVEVRSGDTLVEARCGRVAVRIPTAIAGTRGPDASSGSDVPGGRVDPRPALWWLPGALRDGGGLEGAAGDVDLDAVRAVVAAAWLIADSGMAIAGPAQVHAATG